MNQMKGKNFSGQNLGQRNKSDFYQTPYSITQQLLDTNLFDSSKSILEPACGYGAIVKVLQDNNFNNIISFDKEVDFLKSTNTTQQLITNPPFSLAKEFILHAKQVTSEKIAMLLPLSYLHGKERLETIYSDCNFPLQYVYVFVRYPLLSSTIRSDGKYNTGMMVYAWYIWNKDYRGEPIIRWLDNQQFVVKKSDEF